MTKSEYKKLLESDYWRGYSYAIIKERNWTCEQCGKYIPYARNEFNVHHKKYINDRKPWQYDADLLQVLCKECHAKAHNKYVSFINYDELVYPVFNKYNNTEFNTISKNVLNNVNQINDIKIPLKNSEITNDKYNTDNTELSGSEIVTVFILICFIVLGLGFAVYFDVFKPAYFINENNDDTITTNQIENIEVNFTNKNNDDVITTNQTEKVETIKSDNKETFIDIIFKPIKWIM